MTYNFFTDDRLQPSRIIDVLASCLSVDPNAVDVADIDGEQENRNWGALVFCDHSSVRGDVSFGLDIFVQDTVASRPAEDELASSFAGAAGVVVLYPAEEQIPSAYWLVTPAGLVTRARLLSSDDENPVYSIDAVEAAVPELPDVRVMQLPEIIREQHVPTPETQNFVRALISLQEAPDAPAELRFADEAGSPLRRARECLAAWERMVRRMVDSWGAAGKYPVELYSEALGARDQLAQLANNLPKAAADLLGKSVGRLDEEFIKRSTPDDTWAIESGILAGPRDVQECAWWWRHKPLILPWG
ncbi:hypothetical protein [Streptomyces mexicanus]|uniref:hypothetical protein n=1 Tax=Streptomyces mexicanus TaxID=178566 RepID=UPI0036A67EE2